MYSGDDDDDEGEKRQEERIEGVRVPCCRDAKRRVWQAIDLLKHQHKKTHDGSLRAASVRQQSSPSSEKKKKKKKKKENPYRAAGGGI
jgi:hypothetical protein